MKEYIVPKYNDRKQKYVLRIFWIVLLVLTILYFFTKKFSLYKNLIRIICIVFAATSFLISNNKHNKNKESLESFWGIGFGIIGFIEIFNLIIFNYICYKENVINIDSIICKIKELVWVLEYIILFIAMWCETKKIKTAKVINIFRIILVIVTCYITYVINFSSSIQEKSLFRAFIISLILLFVDVIFFNINYIKDKERKKCVNLYLMFTILYQTVYFLTDMNLIIYSKDILFISYIIKGFTYYIAYERICSFILRQNYDKMYELIDRRRRDFVKSNNLLNGRINSLEELKIAIENGQETYKKAIDSIKDAVVMFEYHSLININKAALELFNISADEAIGISFKEFYGKLSDMRRGKKVRKSFDRDKYSYELCLEKFNGDVITVELFILPIQNNLRLVLIKDVTEKNQIKKLKNYLETHITEEHLKRDFFCNISHELGTPINVIFSALQLNDIYLKNDDLEGIDRNNEIVKMNCLRLIRTINNFIDANKISQGFIEPNMEFFNVVEVVEDIAQAAYKYINKKEIELIFDSEQEEIFIELDRDFLERVVLNILSNSVKYGISSGHIWINIAVIGNSSVAIEVKNDGRKISEEEIEYIFDKFSKTNKSLNRTQEGSGLGLYISKALMEMQGGTLRVYSDYEKGNNFTIMFNNARILDEIRNYDQEERSLNEIMEKVDIEFADIYI